MEAYVGSYNAARLVSTRASPPSGKTTQDEMKYFSSMEILHFTAGTCAGRKPEVLWALQGWSKEFYPPHPHWKSELSRESLFTFFSG